MPTAKQKPPMKEGVQVDRFRRLARQLGTDDDEARFDERLKKLAAAKPKPQPKKPAENDG